MKKDSQQPMEGRVISKNGQDLGDRRFHERDMDANPGDELNSMTDMEVARREELAAELEESNPKTSHELYRRLIAENPKHSHKEIWLKKLEFKLK